MTLHGVGPFTPEPVFGEDQGTARETAGWHLLRPGENLESVASLYAGTVAPAAAGAARGAAVQKLEPGDRVQVQLRSGLPHHAAILSVTGGRIEEQPTPVSWLRGRRFDLLTEGDGLRTYSSASAELWFADTTRLVITEDSLVFLRGGETKPVRSEHPGEIEIISGQADLKNGTRRRPEAEAVEIVLGPARARPESSPTGELDTRARRNRQGTAQVMVYRGRSEVEAAGITVQVEEGTGSVIPAAGPPSRPEPLLDAPALLAPIPGGSVVTERLRFSWGPVAGASSYTFELCHDPDCGYLVDRQTGLRELARELAAVGEGHYFWRVTAVSSSLLDGFPSRSAGLTVSRPKIAEPRIASLPSIVGSVRSGPSSTPLAGAEVRILELDAEVTTGVNGTFELRELPLGQYTLEARVDGLLVGWLGGISVNADRPTEVVIVSESSLVTRDEIVVRPSRVSLLNTDPVAPLALSQDDMRALPHLGGDLFRAVPLLPGTTANDVTAQFHVRGGRRDEVQILLDGQELYDAFHLKDFDNAQSVVAAAALGSVDLMTGGWSAALGDRMGGVLDMRTLTPAWGRRTSLGASFLNLHAGSSGTFGDERGSWFGMVRRGSIDLAAKILGQEDPSYWDGLGKLHYRLGSRHSLSGHALLAGDQLDFQEVEEDGTKHLRTQRDSGYLWLTEQSLLGSDVFVDSFVSWSRVESRRQAEEPDEDQAFTVDDGRDFDVFELRQEWNLQAGEPHLLVWGAGYRSFSPSYDYFNDKEYDTPLAQIRTAQEGTFRFQDSFTEDHTSAFVTDRLKVGKPLRIELGLRYDRYSMLSEEELNPRINLAYSLGARSVLRASWGRFSQSQRPYELQVEDGETRFFPAERSQEALLGFEHTFVGGMALRAEVYQRDIDRPRPRFENLYEPYNTYPELEPERVRIAPERSASEGFEIFLRGPGKGRFGWLANYALASMEDRIDGAWVRRQIDQTHTLNLSFNLTLPRQWILSLAWRYHTGWPTTAIALVELPGGVDEEGEEEVELGVVLGPLYAERLSDYHRLDLRASRELPVRRGRLLFFIDVQNVYNRKNLSGFDISIDEEEGLVATREPWPGIFPSVGISWEF